MAEKAQSILRSPSPITSHRLGHDMGNHHVRSSSRDLEHVSFRCCSINQWRNFLAGPWWCSGCSSDSAIWPVSHPESTLTILAKDSLVCLCFSGPRFWAVSWSSLPHFPLRTLASRLSAPFKVSSPPHHKSSVSQSCTISFSSTVGHVSLF